METYEVRFKISKPNYGLPTLWEALKGKYPKDIIEEVVVTSEEIKKMAILSLFGIEPPEELNRSDVRQAMYRAANDLVCPKDGIHTPYVEIFLRTVDGIRKRQLT